MSKPTLSFSVSVVAAVLVLAGARAATAQQVVKLGEGETLTISGFVNATLFSDRGSFAGSFGNGQNAEWAALAQPGVSQTIFDGDVRNTRINFTFNAPPVLGKWAPRATIESDFFGSFVGTGAPPSQDEQPQMRVRFAFVDLSNGRTTIRVGQFWAPLFGEVPVSLTHLAFPLGYGATGMVGWRYPGVFVYHEHTPRKPHSVQLQVAALKGSGGDVGGGIGSGEASGRPQFETRLNVARKFSKVGWNGYAAYHLDWKNLNAPGVPANDITTWGVETGQNITVGSFTLHGNFYYGKGLGQHFAHINQQQPQIRGWGAWAQAGYDFTPHWSLWLFGGMDQPDYNRFFQETGTALLRQLNHDSDALLRFRAGRYALGLEYFRAVTRWSTGIRSADQYALSVLYTL
jgi:hypothetical protein